MTTEQKAEIIRELVAKLYEHCDAVQVLVSWNESGETTALYRGAGNWYARQGMAREFIEQDIAREHADQIAKRMPPPDDGDDSWKKS